MTICGIVAEWNPFHNGHAHLIQSVRAQYKDALIIVVMSGPFTQRGEAAFFDKWSRAEMSLRSGADAVLELHQSWATASLMNFAAGSIATLNAAGPIDVLAFGSECGDISRLTVLAKELKKPSQAFRKALDDGLQSGLAFGPAQQQAFAETTGEQNLQLRPNDRLAAQYIAHLPEGVRAFTIPRTDAHDSIAAGSGIREALRNNQPITAYIPEQVCAIIERETASGWVYPSEERLFPAVQVLLLQHTPSSLRKLLSYKDGTEQRFYEALKNAASLKELIATVQNRHHHIASLHRDVLQLLAPVSACDQPAYLRVLAASSAGRKHLKILQKNPLPLIQNVGRDAKNLTPQSYRHLMDDVRRQDLSALLQTTAPFNKLGRDYLEAPRML